MNATTIQTRDADRRDVKKSRIAHYFKPSVSRTTLAVASALAMLMVNAPAHAQANGSNESAMVRLIKGLIDSGALKKDVGEALLAQAQAESLTAQQAQRQAAAPATASAAQAGDVRVPYVSQSVRNQIRDEVKQEVMAQAKTEGWASPNEMPEWTKRIQFEGDVRLRNESRFFANDNNDYSTDFNAINAGSGYDVNPNNYKPAPMPNTLQSRKNVWRARARIGLLATISENTKAGVRLATGSDNSPTSTTQTLGGGLSKKNVWLDQAWFSYRVMPGLEVVGGRFANPFYSHDILFSGDLNFDGIAAKFNRQLANNDVSVFGTLGVIPLEYSSDSAPKFTSHKSKSENRWLIGAQVGADWKLDDNNKLRGALAYYHFNNISGQMSTECDYAVDGECSTDWSRPAYMQKGNTLMALRYFKLDPTNPATTPMPQYFGLASKFQLLDINTRWDTKVAGNMPLRVDANYIRNLAYSKSKIYERAGTTANSMIANNFENGPSDFRSGGNAFLLQATLGTLSPSVKNDWNVYVNYRRIEPDALPDAYNDSSFNLGGTNARGFTLGGAYAIDTNTTLNGRWMSSKQVYGAPLSIDVLQVELNTRF